MGSRKCIGYWGTWANYRQGDGKFDYTNIDPNKFTHLIYTFFGLTVDGEIKLLDEWLDIGLGFIAKFIGLKSVNPNCKMLASIGGWNLPPSTFSQMAASATSRSAFAKNTVDFCKKYGFDGMDIDWEYPVKRDADSHPEDKQNFVLLLKEMKSQMEPQGLLLTIAVGATSKQGDISYDIPGIVPSVDFINLMTYDLHGSWDGSTGANAPLYAGSDSNPMLNVDSCVNYWLQQGCPKDKLIVGIPTYGRTFALQDPNQNGVNAPTSGPGNAGPWTQTAGFLGYNEILVNGWPSKWQDDQKVPYAYSGNQWVGYDDEQSVTAKANYIKDKGLGGCMFWSIETDDFRHGSPLITTGSEIMRDSKFKSSHQRDPISFRNNKEICMESYQRDPIAKFQYSIQSVIKKDSRVLSFFFFFVAAMSLATLYLFLQ